MSRWDWVIYGKISTCSQAESLKMKIDGKSTDKMGGSAFTRSKCAPGLPMAAAHSLLDD